MHNQGWGVDGGGLDSHAGALSRPADSGGFFEIAGKVRPTSANEAKRWAAARWGPDVAGQRQKSRDELAFKRGGRDVVVAFDGAAGPLEFSIPHGLLPKTREHVRQLLATMRGYWRESDLQVLRRYMLSLDRWQRETAALDAEGSVVQTLKGQRINARVSIIDRIEKSMRADENTLGLSPLSRMRLGITALTGETALQKLRGGAERHPPARMASAGGVGGGA